jgi:hypothetical protein
MTIGARATYRNYLIPHGLVAALRRADSDLAVANLMCN